MNAMQPASPRFQTVFATAGVRKPDSAGSIETSALRKELGGDGIHERLFDSVVKSFIDDSDLAVPDTLTAKIADQVRDGFACSQIAMEGVEAADALGLNDLQMTRALFSSGATRA